MRAIGKVLLAGMMLSALSLSGCGPGSLIMTAEQEAFEKNVARLLKDNEDLKARVEKLEKGGAGSIEEVKASAVDLAASLDGIRQELNFVRGGIEASEHRWTEIKEEIPSIRSDLETLERRIDAIETSSGKTGEFDSVRDSIRENEKRIGELGERISALEKGAAAESPEALYNRGFEAAMNKEFQAAEETLSLFLSRYPDHKLAGNARYWLGETHYARGDWERAILEFNRVIKDYPGGDKVPAAILKQGMSFEKLGSRKEARVLFEQVLEKFPKSPEAALAKKELEGLK